MKIYDRIETFPKPSQINVTIGTFDGVHLGHQKLLRQLYAKAKEVGGETVVVTFCPPPKQFFEYTYAMSPIQLLTTFEERLKFLEEMGIDHVIKIQFTKAFSQLSAQDFIQQILVAQIRPKHLIIGYDHRFGKGKEGSITLLLEAGRNHYFTVQEVPPIRIENEIVSSTKIRELLLTGAVEKAQTCLGRPYTMTLHLLPYETADDRQGLFRLVPVNTYKLIPAEGHYTVQVYYQDIIAEGTLRILQRYNMPLMELKMPNCSKKILQTHDIRIQFKKYLG
mmetsp:Transcript_3879/g.8750  ORF Transcript_3879/g.8750 Transcript_3879/m.8750 type:complete len:279 (-) Transcript_3879:11049-11885(-)